MTTENLHLNNLMQIFNLNALIKTPTCYQSHNPTCIDNILTNQKALFKLSKIFETGLSDHHKLIQGSDKPGKPGKNVFFVTVRENLENSGNFKKIFKIPGKLREFC